MRALVLLSGGLDSPVAAHLLQEQGVEFEAIHFSLEPFTDAEPERKTLACARALGLSTVHVAPAGPAFAELTRKCDHSLYFVLSKRLMLMVASEWAKRLGCDYLVTGDNLGQVSSQTLINLTNIDRAAGVPVLRPLLAYDKMDITQIAEAIGTFEVSKGPEMCDALGPDAPATHANPDAVVDAEANLDLEALVQGLVDATEPRAVPAEAVVAG